MNKLFLKIFLLVVGLHFCHGVLSQGKVKVGFYLKPLKSLSPFEVTESPYEIKGHNGLVAKWGIFLDYALMEQWHLKLGGGNTARTFGLKVVRIDIEPNHWTAPSYSSRIRGPEIFLHSLF